jgi:hypothetical protein
MKIQQSQLQLYKVAWQKINADVCDCDCKQILVTVCDCEASIVCDFYV